MKNPSRRSSLQGTLRVLNNRHRQSARATALMAAALALGPATTGQAQDVDLSLLGSTHPGFRIDGIDSGDYSGTSVSGAGDVNGDGLADLIIGALGADVGGNAFAGESYVIFGKADNTTVDLASLGSGGFRIDGIGLNESSGSSVSGAGDVNGDGLADLIVGAPGGASYAGQSFVVFGKADGTTVDLSSLGSGGFRIDGVDAVDLSGRSVSGAGDVNGDGLADLIIGAPYANVGATNDSGESYVVFGKADGTTVDLSSLGSGGFRIDGIDTFDNSGYSVSGAGDVNGDGLADLIVGAFGGNSYYGESFVVFGKANGTTVDLSSLGGGGFRIDGAVFGNAGRSVAGAGDVNGDGLADLIVGAPFADSFAGESYVVFGKADGTTVDLGSLSGGGFMIDGIDSGDRAGISVSGAGDVNGDGLADLIIGAYYGDPGGDMEAGESYVVFGKANGTTVDLSSLGSGGYRIDGIDSDDRSGESVSGAGDVNGDGLADLIVGAYYGDPGGDSQAGESYVVFSSSTAPTSATYRAYAGTGNAPALAIGISGDGHDDSTPGSRCWIDFDAGDNGSAGASLQTVTVNRTNSGLTGDLGANSADVVWEITSDRVGWSSAVVTLKYTAAEIAGLTEANLTLYKAENIAGPYTELATTVDTARDTVSATVTSFSFFAIGDGTGLPVGLSEFSVE